MSTLLAAIRSATPGPGTATPAATPELIRDIAPPIDYFPYPVWMVVVAAVLAAALLAGLGYGIYRLAQRKAPPALPQPRAVAINELHRLQGQIRTLAPYEFSIAVSEVLRRFAAGFYHVPALEETSPEFLADIARIPALTSGEKANLATFLERCDALKFGRAEGDETVNEALLSSATAFVQGGAL